jgi:hypothetical protein
VTRWQPKKKYDIVIAVLEKSTDQALILNILSYIRRGGELVETVLYTANRRRPMPSIPGTDPPRMNVQSRPLSSNMFQLSAWDPNRLMCRRTVDFTLRLSKAAQLQAVHFDFGYA